MGSISVERTQWSEIQSTGERRSISGPLAKSERIPSRENETRTRREHERGDGGSKELRMNVTINLSLSEEERNSRRCIHIRVSDREWKRLSSKIDVILRYHASCLFFMLCLNLDPSIKYTQDYKNKIEYGAKISWKMSIDSNMKKSWKHKVSFLQTFEHFFYRHQLSILHTSYLSTPLILVLDWFFTGEKKINPGIFLPKTAAKLDLRADGEINFTEISIFHNRVLRLLHFFLYRRRLEKVLPAVSA